MNAVKFRGNGCDVKATPAVTRHFFAADRAIARALGSYKRRNRASKAAGAALGVWTSFRDFAGLCVAQKAAGRQTRVLTTTTRARR